MMRRRKIPPKVTFAIPKMDRSYAALRKQVLEAQERALRERNFPTAAPVRKGKKRPPVGGVVIRP